MYNTNSDIRFETLILKSSLCDYSDAYILVKGKITITRDAEPKPDPDTSKTSAQLLAARQADKRNEGVIFENCVPFINCKSEINNIKIDNAKDIDIVMPMYNLTEYTDNS